MPEAGDLSQHIEKIKAEKAARTDARKQRGMARGDRGQRIAGALKTLNTARPKAINAAASEYRDKKWALESQARELEQLGEPLSNEDLNARMHAIKKSVGAPARELAKQRRALKPEVAALRKESADDETPESRIIDEEAGINNAESHLYTYPTDRYFTIAEHRRRRVKESEERGRRGSVLTEKEQEATRWEEAFEGDKATVDTVREQVLAHLRDDAQVVELHEKSDIKNGALVKKIERIRQNIELCENPKYEGIWFLKAPVLLNSKGEKFKVTADKLNQFKKEYQEELYAPERELAGNLGSLTEAIVVRGAKLMETELGPIWDKQGASLNIPKPSYDNVHGSMAVSDENMHLGKRSEALYERNNQHRKRYGQLRNEHYAAIRSEARRMVEEWYPGHKIAEVI